MPVTSKSEQKNSVDKSKSSRQKVSKKQLTTAMKKPKNITTLSAEAKHLLRTIFGERATSASRRYYELTQHTGQRPTLEDSKLKAEIQELIKRNSFYSPTRQTILREPGVPEYVCEIELPRALKFEVRRIQEESRKGDADEKRWIKIKEKIDCALEEKGTQFFRNYRAAMKKDDYGNVIFDRRTDEISALLKSLKIESYSLSAKNKKRVNSKISLWYRSMEKKNASTGVVPVNGTDFEHWIANKLRGSGWASTVTQASGDDGVDIIAEKNELRLAVQCKRYSGSVGNTAVQEVFAGMKHMGLDRAVVISTGKYTKSAKQLADTTGVLLLKEDEVALLDDLLNASK